MTERTLPYFYILYSDVCLPSTTVPSLSIDVVLTLSISPNKLSCKINYLSIPKLQRLHRWSLGIDKWFYSTLYHGCNYFNMLGLQSISVNKRSPWHAHVCGKSIIWWRHQMEKLFRLTGHWCGEFTGHRWTPRTKASDTELWCFLWTAPE